VRRLLVLTLLAAALCAVGTAAAQQAGGHPAWAASIEAGLADAKARGQALMVALNMDKERGNQEMVDEVYTSPEFHEGAKRCVVAVASLYQHPVKRDARGAQVCARFGSVTCAQHQAIEKTVRQDWLGRGPKDEVESPRHIFVSPSGKVLFQRIWTVDAPTLAALMTRASELCTPERLAKWDTVDGRIERAADPIAAVREIALAELVASNDPAIDERLVKLAKAPTTQPGVAGAIYAAFVAAATPERRKLGQSGLGDRQPEVRMQVAHALEKLEPGDAIAPLLAQAAREKDDRARGEMYRALGVLGVRPKKDPRVEKLLLKAVSSSGDGARGHAAVAIAPWAAESAVKAELRKVVVQGDSQDTRSAAIWALGYSGDKTLADEFGKLHDGLTLRDWKVRMALESAQAKLAGRDPPGYDDAPRRFLPHPAEGEPPPDIPRDWGK
jgi:HEAT repeat protein